MPCQEIFDKQNNLYKNRILKETKVKISIEAGTKFGWKKYIDDENLIFGINDFGKSAPYKKIFDYFGLNVSNIFRKIKKL